MARVPSGGSDFFARRFTVGAAVTLAAIGLAIGWLPLPPRASAPLPLTGEPANRASGGWQPEAYCAPGGPPARFRHLERLGSWVGGDAFVGEAFSAWYKAPGRGRVTVLVSGYPRLAGNRLAAEVRHRDGSIARIPFEDEDVREAWRAWEFEPAPGAEAVRIHGVDAESGMCGWLAFTEPTSTSLASTWSPVMTAQTVGMVALALLVVFGPGLLWQHRRGTDLQPVLWTGPLLLITGGLFCWALGGTMPVRYLALAWVGATAVTTILLGARWRVWSKWTAVETHLLALASLCVLGGAAKAAISGGPPGELYGGSVSRTLEIGPYSDSRIPFHTVQLVANHLSPYEPEGSKYFAPWSFSHRGPLAGLATAPLVLAVNGRPPLAMPDQTWAPFDREGFAAFRIAMMALSALALVAVAGLVQHVAGPRPAALAASLLALTPFFWHELYFTWPKMLAATWVLGAAWLMVSGRSYLAGAALGAAYLQHGLALLSAPVLVVWSLFFLPARNRPAITPTVYSGLGLLTVLIGWYAANAGHVASAGFLQYFVWADGGPATWSTWWSSRWNSWADTFVPLYVWQFNAGHPCFNAIGGASGRFEQFFLQYWTAAPFGAGLLTTVFLLPAGFRAVRRQPGAATLVVLGPMLLMTAYWGAYITGMMREAGHVLFLSGWGFLAWAAADAVPRWLQRTPGLLLRSAELLLALHASALVAGAGTFSPEWRLNDAGWLIMSAAAVSSIAVLVRAAHRDVPLADDPGKTPPPGGAAPT